MGGGAGLGGADRREGAFSRHPTTSGVNPTGKGSTEEKGRQRDSHTEMEKDRDKTKATWQKGRKWPSRC